MFPIDLSHPIQYPSSSPSPKTTRLLFVFVSAKTRNKRLFLIWHFPCHPSHRRMSPDTPINRLFCIVPLFVLTNLILDCAPEKKKMGMFWRKYCFGVQKQLNWCFWRKSDTWVKFKKGYSSFLKWRWCVINLMLIFKPEKIKELEKSRYTAHCFFKNVKF